MRRNLILDVDTGIDDSLGIIYAINDKNSKVNLITCCYCSSKVENTTKNTLNVLNFVQRTEVPVAQGEKKPLLQDRDNSIEVHGSAGLGEYKFSPIKVGKISENAIDAMYRVIMETKGKTTIIALAPLTNIAKMLWVYPDVVKKIKHIVISGGLLYDKKDKPYIGFNISQDAYATEYIFNSKVKVVICPSDFGHEAFLDFEDQEKLAEMNKAGKVFKEIFKSYKDRHVKSGCAAMHDACAVACETDRDFFKYSSRWVYVRRVRAAGNAAIIDFDAKLKKKHIKAKVVTQIDVQKFKKRFFERWKYLP